MKVEYINPFLESAFEMFDRMLKVQAQRGDVTVTKGAANPREIMAIIGLSGAVRGTVALAFPTGTALALVGRLLEQELRVVDETVSDGLAEFVNIVAGNAKSRMARNGQAIIDLSLPTVLRGSSFQVDHPSNATWLEVPFTSDLGPFTLRVTFVINER